MVLVITSSGFGPGLRDLAQRHQCVLGGTPHGRAAAHFVVRGWCRASVYEVVRGIHDIPGRTFRARWAAGGDPIEALRRRRTQIVYGQAALALCAVPKEPGVRVTVPRIPTLRSELIELGEPAPGRFVFMILKQPWGARG